MHKFIVIDGQHGSGKTYIVDKLCKKLMHNGYSVIKTKEPTDSEIGVFARKAENHYAANILACLFAADRMQHCQQIQKWLKEDKIVVCDRYMISGMILQNMDGVDFNYIKAINSNIIVPDLSIVIYADPKIVKVRLKNKVLTRLSKQEQFEGYDRYLKHQPELIKMYNNIYFFPNNTLEDAEKITNFIIEQIN